MRAICGNVFGVFVCVNVPNTSRRVRGIEIRVRYRFVINIRRGRGESQSVTGLFQ